MRDGQEVVIVSATGGAIGDGMSNTTVGAAVWRSFSSVPMAPIGSETRKMIVGGSVISSGSSEPGISMSLPVSPVSDDG